MPSLPVAREYLAVALRDGFQIDDIRLVHRRVGDLLLPTGELVACDPVVSPETELL